MKSFKIPPSIRDIEGNVLYESFEVVNLGSRMEAKQSIKHVCGENTDQMELYVWNSAVEFSAE